jgi:hypothetical protein
MDRSKLEVEGDNPLAEGNSTIELRSVYIELISCQRHLAEGDLTSISL